MINRQRLIIPSGTPLGIISLCHFEHVVEITLPHHFFTTYNINTTLGRLVYGAAIKVIYHTIAKAIGGVGLNLVNVGEIHFHDIGKLFPIVGCLICLFCTNGHIECCRIIAKGIN